jgi:drug/metabolite transporter (DMT)-like permease
MSGALLSLGAMAVATRELTVYLSISQILFFRSACGLVIVGFFLWCTNWRQIISPQIGSHFVRNSSHLLAQYTWIYGIIFIPMAEVFAIEFTAPLWTTLLAAILLKERITRARLIAVCMGFFGVLLIVRPGFSTVHHASLVVLVGAVFFAVAYIMTKKIAKTDTPLCILFYMTAIQMPLALIPSSFNWQPVVAQAWPGILTVGIMALTAHYCLARAMKMTDATIVVTMDFLRLPLIAVVGAMLYEETVQAWVFVGAALIVAGNALGIKMEKRADQPKQQ